MCFITLNTVLLKFVEIYQDKLLDDSKLILKVQQGGGYRTYFTAILRMCRSANIIDSSLESTMISYIQGETGNYYELNRCSDIFKDDDSNFEARYSFISRFLRKSLSRKKPKDNIEFPEEFKDVGFEEIPKIPPMFDYNSISALSSKDLKFLIKNATAAQHKPSYRKAEEPIQDKPVRREDIGDFLQDTGIYPQIFKYHEEKTESGITQSPEKGHTWE